MNGKLTLTELQLLIRDSIYISLPDMYWVIAEISEMKVNSTGHCYLELIEKQKDDKDIRARIKAIIWNNRFRFLKAFFENSTGQSLQEGMKVLIRSKVEYHEIYGISLVITDIDPAFTLGEMAIKRQQIIKRLEEEGIFSMNKDMEFPPVPQRIAVVSSRNAAGYIDFINHLKTNSYGYTFYTALYESAVQGSETETGIVNALDRIALNTDMFDAVAIIRGGGSTMDLSWFDNYTIAYHITQFPLPVLTGIGHEKDLSVTDLVSFKSLKTPTAVADFLIESIAGTEEQLLETANEIKEISRNFVTAAREELTGIFINLTSAGNIYFRRYGSEISSLEIGLISSTKNFLSGKASDLKSITSLIMKSTINLLDKAKTKGENLSRSLQILDPEKVLSRGFTITALNGKIIRSTSELKEDDIIETIFTKGRISSKVLEKKPGDKISGQD